LEDESDEVKPVAARKTVRVLEPKPAAEPKRKVATEAFEPIETERHEEPVAEGNSPARVRLRSAN
jgi:hypothetical protein